MSQLRIGECSSHWPGVGRPTAAGGSISDLPNEIPRSRAVLPRPAGGVTSHITTVTRAISITTEAKLCQRKIVCRNGMMPPATRPLAATMSRICGCSAPGVAICRAADPLKPCAQTLPSPRKLAAASAR